ncbi:MAG TPA: NADH-quinone oxidoreductase subunit M [Mycobacteriales bacterium]|jgi:NADH-quinone oxidoreductase subunit M|nr:NADH-quinone oxidoreductase subunit M [Mycobacteriales bacterium]
MLLILGLVPLVGSLVVFALPRGRDLLAKQVALLFSLATLAITIGLCVAFDDNSSDRFQYVTSYEWIRSFGVHFSLGADGIALVLIALVAVLVPAVVIASWSERDRAVDAEAPATAAAAVRAGGTNAVATRAAGRSATTGATPATAVLDRPAPGGDLDRPRDDDDEDILVASDTVLVTDEDTTPRAPGTRRGQPKTFFALLLLLEVMMIGVFAATDVFLFYVFFEAMLIPMYFLIGSFGGPRRQYAAVKFFLYSLLGGLIMLAAVIGLYFATSTRTFDFATLVGGSIDPGLQKWLFLGFFVAFAIKAPLVPFHTWLPDAGAEAPVGGAALLVGVLDKVGTFGFIRYCLPLFPDASRFFAPLVLVLSAIGILYAALLAMGQKDMKRLVAYTSVAHFGFIGLGIFAFTTQSLSGATFYMVNHGLSTGALFLVIGMVIARGGSRMLADYGGIQKVAPILGGVFLVTGLSSLALPGMSTFVSEFLVLLGTYARHPVYAIIGTAGIILAALYILLVIQRVVQGPVRGLAAGGMRDMVGREVLAVAPLLALILFLGVYPKPVLDMINPAVTRTMQDAGYTDPAPDVPAGAQSGGGR